MSATNKLLDKFAETCSQRQDKEIAARLHVKPSAVSNWRNGRAHPDVDSIEKMALAMGEPVWPWVAAIQAERTHKPNARKVWLRLASQASFDRAGRAAGPCACATDENVYYVKL